MQQKEIKTNVIVEDQTRVRRDKQKYLSLYYNDLLPEIQQIMVHNKYFALLLS